MRWYKCLFLTILLFIGCPKLTKALTCSNAEMVKYQELAKNVNTSYDYVEHFSEQGSTVVFSIKLSNVQPGLMIKDIKNNATYRNIPSELTLNGYQYGKSYRFDIYINEGNCAGKLAYSKYVNLPFYNKYYKDELCKGIEEFRYCQKWTKFGISYYEFTQEVQKYKNNFKEEEKVNNSKKLDDVFKVVSDFYLQYYYIILPIIIIILSIIIYKHNKKDDLF